MLPGVAALPPVLRDAAVLGVLRALPQLGAQDRTFSAWLRQVPFVPNNKVRAGRPWPMDGAVCFASGLCVCN